MCGGDGLSSTRNHKIRVPKAWPEGKARCRTPGVDLEVRDGDTLTITYTRLTPPTPTPGSDPIPPTTIPDTPVPLDPCTDIENQEVPLANAGGLNDADHMLPDMKKWTDNPEDAWYYADVQEAANGGTSAPVDPAQPVEGETEGTETEAADAEQQ